MLERPGSLGRLAPAAVAGVFFAASLATCTVAPGKVPEDDQIACNDGIDDDGDGLTDCEDDGCALFCPGACGNGACEPTSGESCAACPSDCTACACTADGTCAWYLGETCGGCASDCGCGAGDCGAFVDCLGACAAPDCPVACWEATCIRGQEQYTEVTDCQRTSCAAQCDPMAGTPADCTDCTMSSCMTELSQCLLGGC